MEKLESHFDARAELKNIRNLDDNEKELPKEERLKLRKERLEDIKKKLADQMMGIAQTNAGLEKLVFSGEDLTLEKASAFLQEAISTHKLAPWQVEEYEKAIEKVIERNSLVNRFFAENCEGKTGEEIFEFIFDKKPQGEVLIEKGILCPIIFCENDDFIDINQLAEAEIVENGDSRKRSENFEGLAVHFNEKAPTKFADFGNSLIVLRGAKLNISEISEKITHENKHIFDNLVFPNEEKVIRAEYMEKEAIFEENLSKISDEELNSLSAEDAVKLFAIKRFEAQLDAMRKLSEVTAKKEILAFYKQGVESNCLYSWLSSSHGGKFYKVIDDQALHVFEYILKMFAGAEQEKAIAMEFYKKIHIREKELYKQHLFDATQAIYGLERVRIARGEIMGLFETEPLENWDKIFERIKKSDVYKIKDKRKYIKTTEDDIKSHNEADEQIRKNFYHKF